ncbi:MAG: tetratricopeptide repeat protein [Methanothrix sp.]
MTKVISVIAWIALALLCVQSLAQEDSASHWLSKGDDLLEQALNITQNRTDKEFVLQEALKSYDRALHSDPLSASGWYKNGKALVELARFEEGLPCFNKSLEINPRNADAWYLKGIILTVMGRYEEAINAYNESVVLNPHLVDAWYMMGGTFAELGRFEEAVRCYDAAIEIDPLLSKA